MRKVFLRKQILVAASFVTIVLRLPKVIYIHFLREMASYEYSKREGFISAIGISMILWFFITQFILWLW
ncbi:Uncharacterised protein [Serratia proteamaculans]|jgi:hypothetical protein|nr:Uncharacterised protein [Serratia proteamaculans]CAI1059081.1 Uncharacterised protein [Serratia proteamaculans]CAI2474660.1 Uncharacterised protein [Serratia proteamaculans]SPZ52635.1 Uncharacterised protein [Serratia quinivorans]